MCIFHCLEVQGLQGVEQKMGINLQLKGCHLSQLLFLLLKSQLAAQKGLVQKELDDVVEDYIIFILDERGLFRVKYATLRIREQSRGDFFVDFYEYKDTFDTSGFDETFISQFGTFDGKLLALPTGMSCLATVANKNAAETCGVDLTKQITWDSMLEDGKKLHAENPDYYYLNTDTKILCEYVLRPYLRQMTGESFIIDSEKKMSFTREQLVEVLTYIKDCYDGGVFEPAEDSATFKGQIHTNPKWMDGKFVFAYGPSSSINLLMDAVPEAECTVVQMPMAEDRVNDGFFADTPQYMTVNKNSEHVEEAVDFLNYFYNNTEAQETLKDVRSIPPTSTARQLCADKGLLNQTVVDAVDLAAGLNGKSDKGYTTSAEVYAIQEDMIESIAYGQSTPEEAADNAIELINDYLSGLN